MSPGAGPYFRGGDGGRVVFSPVLLSAILVIPAPSLICGHHSLEFADGPEGQQKGADDEERAVEMEGIE